METARWIMAVPLALMSLSIIVGNPVAGIQAERAGRNYSAVPFVGGVLGGVACLMCPAVGLSWWALVPLVLDYTIPGFVYVLLRGEMFR